jgi:hypothetical protein
MRNRLNAQRAPPDTLREPDTRNLKHNQSEQVQYSAAHKRKRLPTLRGVTQEDNVQLRRTQSVGPLFGRVDFPST